MTAAKQDDLPFLIETARLAGEAILKIYNSEFEVTEKDDASPLTAADMASHHLILDRLRGRFPETPIISEENSETSDYETRRAWTRFWLVDPLDGTKEFIKRNGQFTVNIALIEGGRPTMGVVFAPAVDALYYGAESHGAFREIQRGAPERLPFPRAGAPDSLIIVGSRSHPTPEMDRYLEEQRQNHGQVDFLAIGSSLKLCMVAAGLADVYPRFGPTMEWDTAAAHAVAAAAGKTVKQWGTESELAYNKPDLHNPWFIVS